MVHFHPTALLSLALALAWAPAANAEEWAGAVRNALGQLRSGPSGAWACTVESTRNATKILEHGEGEPSGRAHWVLTKVDGRPPKPQEIQDHEAYRATQPSPLGVNFQPADLDLASVSLIRRGDASATVRVGFRESAIKTDRLLGQLELTALVDLRASRVRSYTLALRHPCSPVLGVRLHELEVRMEFDREGSPLRSHARSRGSVFFRGYSEEILVRFLPSPKTPSSGRPARQLDEAG